MNDRKQARLRRTREAIKKLDLLEVSYTLKNQGHHIIVTHDGRQTNFWPQGDKWSWVGGRGDVFFGMDEMLKCLGRI